MKPRIKLQPRGPEWARGFVGVPSPMEMPRLAHPWTCEGDGFQARGVDPLSAWSAWLAVYERAQSIRLQIDCMSGSRLYSSDYRQ